MFESCHSFVLIRFSIDVREPKVTHWRAPITYIKQLNLFPSKPPSNDPILLKNQRLSTRIFIVLIGISLTILIVYTSTVEVTKLIQVSSPSYHNYQDIYRQHSDTVLCTCTEIAIDYQSFLNITYEFHQICNSLFVTTKWMDVFSAHSESSLSVYEFRVTGRQQFQALISLCSLSNETIVSSLEQFYPKKYVSSVVIPEEQFRLQSNALIEEFILSVTNKFGESLEVIRDMTQANGFTSGSSSNFALYLNPYTSRITTEPKVYDNNCSCSASSQCYWQSFIYRNRTEVIKWYVPGFFSGCFTLESLRQCELGCFYNQTCLNELIFEMRVNISFIPMAMNVSVHTRFANDAPMRTIIDRLMVEDWYWNISHESYYSICRPYYCSYTVETRNDRLFIITTVIGLVGGLSTALKIIILPIASLIFRCNRHRRGVTPTP